MANYATSPQDKVLLDGRQVGVSYYPVYTVHLNGWFSLAAIDSDLAVDGRELTLIWGEPDGGSAKPTVEPHVQKEIRVTVDARPVKRD